MNTEKKILNLGYTIVDGPVAIYRPGNDFDRYGQDVFIRINITDVRDNINQITGHESISIWTDDTMNKEKKFFPPIIRHAKWKKIDDLDKIRKKERFGFPAVRVRLGEIKDKKKLEDELLVFQEQIKTLPYIPSGLSLERDVPDLSYDTKFSAYTVFFRNGVQSVEFSSEPVLDDVFTENVFGLFKKIKRHMDVFSQKGWVEKYDFDFSSMVNSGFYRWDYSKRI